MIKQLLEAIPVNLHIRLNESIKTIFKEIFCKGLLQRKRPQLSDDYIYHDSPNRLLVLLVNFFGMILTYFEHATINLIK